MAKAPKAAATPASAAAEPTPANTDAAAEAERASDAAVAAEADRLEAIAAEGAQVTTTLPPIENGFAATLQEAPESTPRTVLPGDTLESLCGRVLMVRSVSANGFWRAGRKFTPEETPVEVDELTPRQLDALINEPALVVTID